MNMSGFCIDCNFKIDSFDNLEECPNCNSKTIPCSDKDQVNINVNWHELKMLTIWAEQWGNEKCNGAGTIYSIAQRIQEQYPNMPLLSLAESIQDLGKKLKIKTNVKGVEKDKEGNVK